MSAPRVPIVALACVAIVLTGCAGQVEPPAATGGPAGPSATATPDPVPTAAPPTTPAPTEGPHDPAFVVRYRVVVDAAGLDLDDVATTIAKVLDDPRGWARAGFVFVPDDQPGGPSSALPVVEIVVAEGPEIDRRCRPYDTYGRYSCQLGPTVNLNADRWRGATPEWTGDLDGYRTYLVNHEVGHVLGLHHPRPQCPGEGLPAPIMLQQSTELGPCTANPWPLRWEVELAASRVEPFAPGYEPDPDGRPSPPPATE